MNDSKKCIKDFQFVMQILEGMKKGSSDTDSSGDFFNVFLLYSIFCLCPIYLGKDQLEVMIGVL